MAVNKFSILFVKSPSEKRGKTKKCIARHLIGPSGWDRMASDGRMALTEVKELNAKAKGTRKNSDSEVGVGNWALLPGRL